MTSRTDFGANVHVSSSALVWTWLAKLSSRKTRRLEAIRLLGLIYQNLFSWLMADEFPREPMSVITRMNKRLRGIGIKARVPVTIVDIIRAGMRPSLLCHELLLTSDVIDERLVHEHHIVASRKTDRKGRVIGVNYDDSKAQERVRPGSIVIIPDPMLATGGSLSAVIARYKDLYPGKVAKFIVVSLIATPKGIARIHKDHPEVVIYVGRIDPKLTPKSYIVPGAGGLGELMTGTKK